MTFITSRSRYSALDGTMDLFRFLNLRGHEGEAEDESICRLRLDTVIPAPSAPLPVTTDFTRTRRGFHLDKKFLFVFPLDDDNRDAEGDAGDAGGDDDDDDDDDGDVTCSRR